MLFEQFSRAKEDFTTFRRWHQSPFLKGCSRSGNGGICVSLARKRKISQDFTCCRIVISKVLAAFRALPTFEQESKTTIARLAARFSSR